jgi:hypothetical protein
MVRLSFTPNPTPSRHTMWWPKERPEDVERKKAYPTGRVYSVLMRMVTVF